MKKLFTYYVCLIMLATTSACSGFLDVYPVDSVPEKEAYKNYDDFYRHWISVYSSLKSSNGFTEASRIYGDIQCDLVYSVQGFKNALGNLHNWQFNSTTTDVVCIYDAMWMTIGRINRIFDHLEEMEAATTGDNLAKMKSEVGDLYFIRALCYSELVKYYCEAYDPATADQQLGMPVCTTAETNNPARASLKATYDFIYSDLEEAEKRVTYTLTLPNLQKGLNALVPTQAIPALRARMALYQKDYPLASSEAMRAMEACEKNGLSLCQSEEEYWNLFTMDAGTEVIFLIGMTPTDLMGSVGQYFCYKYGPLLYPDYIPSRYFLDLYDATDYRKATMFSKEKTGYTHGLVWEVLLKDGHNRNLDMSPNNPAWQSAPKLFRMSELCLIVAEANAMPGMDLKEGNRFLQGLQSCRMSSYNKTTLSAVELLKEVKRERVRELCFEGFRLADLKRWNEGFLRKPQPFTNAPFNELEIRPGNPGFTWPIPKHELDANKNMLPNKSN